MFIKEISRINEFEFKTKTGKVAKRKRKSGFYLLKCDNCNNEFERSRHELSPSRANNNYKHFCSKCGNVYNLASKIGLIGIQNRQKSLLGSKIIDSAGYIALYVGTDYKYSNTYGNRIREHIYIIQESIGRQIKEDEVVHHIDGDKTNNELSNLDLCTVTEHNNCHAKSEKIVFELYKKGIVGYNKIDKRYYLC